MNKSSYGKMISLRPLSLTVALCAVTQVRLTSSAVPDEKDDTTVVIGPPFYLSAKLVGKELPIQVRPS